MDQTHPSRPSPAPPTRASVAHRWGWPGNARKAHVFANGDSVALCGKWMFTGPKTDLGTLGDKPGPDNCAACWRKAKAAS